jgi:hypothetical protein
MTHVRRSTVVAVAALVVALGTVLAGVVGAAEAKTPAKPTWKLTDPFAREIVRPGDVDKDAYHIEHVYEVQYRLRWLGLFKATPNGRFGPVTKSAVLAFQAKNGLRKTGTVNYATWQPLIKQTIRARKLIPKACHNSGWHTCYDRFRHQLTLFHNGHLYNAWLVRGGTKSSPTRTGTFRVYYRDIDHRSSEFDNAPMPYSQFFSGGEALHGSRYMVSPFVDHSHGCINMYVEDARVLWRLTSTHRLMVHVYGRWS